MADDEHGTELRARAIEAALDYHRHVEGQRRRTPFTPGDRIPYGGRVYDGDEISLLVDASLDFWLTAGRYAQRFERELAETLGVAHCSLTNSGSSANLLAIMALSSPSLGKRRIRRSDEVITVAAGFPTTVAPILQLGAEPVFLDIKLPTYNVDVTQLEEARSKKTKAVILAHTLGNPFDLAQVKSFCEAHQLWLIEDNCDALGSRYHLGGEWRLTGSIGDLGTSSFYPPHHITRGEGGAVYTSEGHLKRLVESFRDWGRDCICPPGQDNTCRKRFKGHHGELPVGYDHKYVYSHLGYNLKVTDMQAAIGCAQLAKLPAFVDARRTNFGHLKEALADYEDLLILPEATAGSEPSWFGFPLTVRPGAPFSRAEIVSHLEEAGIQTRMLFAGNLLRHPCFDELRREGRGYRVVGDLSVTDQVMSDTFWLGLYPGLSQAQMSYMVDQLQGFLRSR